MCYIDLPHTPPFQPGRSGLPLIPQSPIYPGVPVPNFPPIRPEPVRPNRGMLDAMLELHKEIARLREENAQLRRERDAARGPAPKPLELPIPKDW